MTAWHDVWTVEYAGGRVQWNRLQRLTSVDTADTALGRWVAVVVETDLDECIPGCIRTT